MVRLIYTGLALLMGVGLIGFGIGGGFGGGGILNAAGEGEGGGGPNYEKKIASYEKTLKRDPGNLPAHEKIVENRILLAGGEKYVTSTGLTSKGHELFREASEAWASYLGLNPPKPSVKLAKRVLVLFGEGALNEPSKAVQALQIIVAADPESSAYYGELAEFAYQAKNERVGDLASKKAVQLAPSSERVRVKKQLEEFKKAIKAKELEGKSVTGTVPTGSKTVTATVPGVGTVTAPVNTTGSGTSTSTTSKK
jgi:tetratricopeptide (TPR) repeat protein